MTTTSLADLHSLLDHSRYRRVPLARTVYSDHTTPLRLLSALKERYSHIFLLESVSDPQHRGRYTFLGYQPTLTVTAQDGTVTVTPFGREDAATTTAELPRDVIARIIAEHRSPRLPELPPFTGGLVGYLAYDYFAVHEPALHLHGTDDEGFRDLDLMLFENVICFDHLTQHIVLITNIPTENLDESYLQGLRTLDEMENLVFQQPTQSVAPLQLHGPLTPDMTCEQYSAMVEIAGASPETLVSVQDGVAKTFPLAGTRPRGATAEEDAALEYEVLHDPKELAEHYMLVDLGRNDLGRFVAPGTVKVTELAQVHRYSHVMHIGSVVEAQLAEGANVIDAVGSVLPAGTLSGAPKIRACQIIDELEGVRRGVYGGALGYFDLTGNMDMCIAIRFAYKRNGVVAVRSGAGIVADSVPATEYQETINKAKAVVEALERANGGLPREAGAVASQGEEH